MQQIPTDTLCEIVSHIDSVDKINQLLILNRQMENIIERCVTRITSGNISPKNLIKFKNLTHFTANTNVTNLEEAIAIIKLPKLKVIKLNLPFLKENIQLIDGFIQLLNNYAQNHIIDNQTQINIGGMPEYSYTLTPFSIILHQGSIFVENLTYLRAKQYLKLLEAFNRHYEIRNVYIPALDEFTTIINYLRSLPNLKEVIIDATHSGAEDVLIALIPKLIRVSSNTTLGRFYPLSSFPVSYTLKAFNIPMRAKEIPEILVKFPNVTEITLYKPTKSEYQYAKSFSQLQIIN